jgi:hypothetical protein
MWVVEGAGDEDWRVEYRSESFRGDIPVSGTVEGIGRASQVEGIGRRASHEEGLLHWTMWWDTEVQMSDRGRYECRR